MHPAHRARWWLGADISKEVPIPEFIKQLGQEIHKTEESKRYL
jgi:hypothetical protein